MSTVAKVPAVALLTLAVLSLLGGCGDSGGEAVAEAPTPTVSEPDPTATVLSSDEPGEADGADEDDQSDETDETDAVGPLPEPEFAAFLRDLWDYGFQARLGRIESDMGRAPVLLPPDTYETAAMFTPMTFALDEHTRLLADLPAFLALVDHSAAELWRPPLIEFVRPHRLVDPSQTAEGPPEWPDPVEGWDFDAWFAAVPGLDVERTELDIGGIAAVRYDIDMPSDGSVGWEAGPNSWRTPVVLRYGEGPYDLGSDELHRIWVVPQQDQVPILAFAAVDRDDGWDEFGPKFEAIVDSIEFGAQEPVPYSERLWEDGFPAQIPAGPVTLPVLGGVSFELPGDYFVAQSPNWSYIDMADEEFELFPPNVEVAAAIEAVDGTAIENAEQLADLMVERASAVRLADGEIAGRPAAVVEMLGVQPGVPVFRHIDTPDDIDPGLAGWFTQDFVQLWAVDTDDGVLIVTAEADSQEALDVALGLHDAVRTSLTLN